MDDLLARGSEKWTKYPPDVLPAWIAEMDFALAPPVRDALVRAVELGDLGYIGNVDGLIEAMYSFYDRRLGWDLEGQYIALAADVMVGFKELLLVHTQPGDGVIINPPAYPPYFKDIAHVGRRVVEVPLLEDFGVDVDGLDRAFGAGAKALLLCSPHNPSGRVYTRDELTAVAAVAVVSLFTLSSAGSPVTLAQRAVTQSAPPAAAQPAELPPAAAPPAPPEVFPPAPAAEPMTEALPPPATFPEPAAVPSTVEVAPPVQHLPDMQPVEHIPDAQSSLAPGPIAPGPALPDQPAAVLSPGLGDLP